jgi:hypothetical protein
MPTTSPTILSQCYCAWLPRSGLIIGPHCFSPGVEERKRKFGGFALPMGRYAPMGGELRDGGDGGMGGDGVFLQGSPFHAIPGQAK